MTAFVQQVLGGLAPMVVLASPLMAQTSLTIYSDGGIRGTPAVSGMFSFSVGVVATSGSASQAYSIDVLP